MLLILRAAADGTIKVLAVWNMVDEHGEAELRPDRVDGREQRAYDERLQVRPVAQAVRAREEGHWVGHQRLRGSSALTHGRNGRGGVSLYCW